MNMYHRKSPRLRTYDYGTAGYYFLTLCTHQKQCLFGTIRDGVMTLNNLGRLAESELTRIPAHFPSAAVDQYVIMPNHIHCILAMKPEEGSRPFPTVPVVVGLYKSGVTRLAREWHADIVVWQKSFYDHILRDEKGYRRVCEYIAGNPLKWLEDEYHVS